MDSGPHVIVSQKKKPTKRQKCKEGEDMISNLPDLIIGRILSVLPTKEAVRTSVLSKRWIYLWTFITDLRFDDSQHFSPKKIRKMSFLNHVNRVLFHLNSSSIQSFSLSMTHRYDPSHINEWISVALNRRVKKLRVYSLQELPIFSHSLLKYQDLEKLELRIGGSAIRVPRFVCFSSLAVLKLTGITFTCCSSNDSQKLTLSFPVLKKYETKNCTWSGVKSVTFDVPLLKVVFIDYSHPYEEPHAEIKFCASRLAELIYSGGISSKIILLAAHTASADITLYNFKKSLQETVILVCMLLSNSAECLNLDLSKGAMARGISSISAYNEVLARTKYFLADNPAFGMLSRLELGFVTGKFLLGFLSKSSCLKTLVFQQVKDFDEELLNSATVPDCFLSTLQMVKYGWLDGKERELRFAKFVMENAQVLERISFTFSSSCRLGGSDLEKVKERIFSFKNSYSFAIIELSSSWQHEEFLRVNRARWETAN